jgi:hypothetical protein
MRGMNLRDDETSANSRPKTSSVAMRKAWITSRMDRKAECMVGKEVRQAGTV